MRPHQPVPQTMYWSQTESSKWSLRFSARIHTTWAPPLCARAIWVRWAPIDGHGRCSSKMFFKHTSLLATPHVQLLGKCSVKVPAAVRRFRPALWPLSSFTQVSSHSGGRLVSAFLHQGVLRLVSVFLHQGVLRLVSAFLHQGVLHLSSGFSLPRASSVGTRRPRHPSEWPLPRGPATPAAPLLPRQPSPPPPLLPVA